MNIPSSSNIYQQAASTILTTDGLIKAIIKSDLGNVQVVESARKSLSIVGSMMLDFSESFNIIKSKTSVFMGAITTVTPLKLMTSTLSSIVSQFAAIDVYALNRATENINLLVTFNNTLITLTDIKAPKVGMFKFINIGGNGIKNYEKLRALINGFSSIDTINALKATKNIDILKEFTEGLVGFLLNYNKIFLKTTKSDKDFVYRTVLMVIDNSNRLIIKLGEISNKSLNDTLLKVNLLGNIYSRLRTVVMSIASLALLATVAGPLILLAIPIIGMAVRGILWAIRPLTNRKRIDDVMRGTRSLMLVTGSLLLFGLSLVVLSEIFLTENILFGILSFVGYVLMITLIMRYVSNEKKRTIAGSVALFIITTSMLIFGMGLKIFSTVVLDGNILLGVLAFVGYVLMITLIMKLMSSKTFGKSLLVGSVSLFVITTSMLIFGMGLKIFSTVVLDGNILLGVLAFVGYVLMITLIMKFLSSPASMKSILIGNLSLILLSATMLLSAFMLQETSKQFDQISWTGLTLGTLALIGIVGLIAALGFGMASGGALFVALGTAALVGTALALASISGAFMIVNSLGLTADIVDQMRYMGEGMCAFIGSLPSMTDIWTASLKVPPILGLSLAIASIGTSVQMIAALKMPIGFDKDGKPTGYIALTAQDFTQAGTNVGLCISSLISPMMRIAGGEIMNEQGKWVKVDGVEELFEGTGFLGLGFSPITRVIIASRRLGNVISKIAIGVSEMAQLSIPIYDEKTGDIRGRRVLTPADFTLAATNTSLVIGTMINAMASLSESTVGGVKVSDLVDDTWFTESPIQKVIKVSLKLGNLISSLAGGIKDLSTLNIPIYDSKGNIISRRQLGQEDFAAAGRNVSTICTAIISGLVGLIKDPIYGQMLEPDFWDFGQDNTSMLARTIDAAVRITGTIEPIAKNVVAMSRLEFLSADGKITTTLTQSDITAAGTNIGIILKALVTGVQKTAISPEFKELTETSFWDFGEDNTSKLARTIDAAQRIAGILTPIASNIVSISNMTFTDVSGKEVKLSPSDIVNAGNNVKSILTIFSNSLASMSNNKNLSKALIGGKSSIASMVVKFMEGISVNISTIKTENVDMYDKALQSTTTFLDKVNTIDINKVKQVTSLVGNIASLSGSIRGDFNKLADVLSDKLMKVIIELKEILEETNKTITQRDIEPSVKMPSIAPAVTQTFQNATPPTPTQKLPESNKNLDLTLLKLNAILTEMKQTGIKIENSELSPLYVLNAR